MFARPEITGRRYLTNAALARYLGVSTMTLWRWKHDPTLCVPSAIVIKGKDRNDLVEWENWLRTRKGKSEC
jgi:hypothetical protein